MWHYTTLVSSQTELEYPLKKLILIHVYSCTSCRKDTTRPGPDEDPFASSFAAVYVSCGSAHDLSNRSLSEPKSHDRGRSRGVHLIATLVSVLLVVFGT